MIEIRAGWVCDHHHQPWGHLLLASGNQENFFFTAGFCITSTGGLSRPFHDVVAAGFLSQLLQ
jgi:hypothetical protein